MSIPKIIHQTFKSRDIPPKYSSYRDGLTALHPGWEYKFYDDEACRQAVERHFPAFLAIYDRASVIQRTDIFRVIVVYGEGGFYMDMDVECLNPLDALCGFRCVFAEESTLTGEEALRLGHRDRLRVANCMFGSEPGHPFLLYILRKMAGESRRDILTENDVLESTGPGLVTTVYHDFRDKLRDVVLLPNPQPHVPCLGGGGVSFRELRQAPPRVFLEVGAQEGIARIRLRREGESEQSRCRPGLPRDRFRNRRDTRTRRNIYTEAIQGKAV